MVSQSTFNPRSNHASMQDGRARPFMRRRIVVLAVSAAAAIFACAAVLFAWQQFVAPPLTTTGSGNVGARKVAPLLQSIKNIRYTGELTHLDAQALQLFSNSIRGNIWSVDLNEVRAAAQSYSWVRKAEVRRSFPDGLSIKLEEHKPFAKWGTGEYSFVNTFGEVFEISPLALKPNITPSTNLPLGGAGSTLKMPVFRGPTGSVGEVVRHYLWLQKRFATLNREVMEVRLSGRGALSVRDSAGTVVELGRLQMEERLERVLSAWSHVAAMQKANMHIDARYPSGLALSVNIAPQPALPEPTTDIDLPADDAEKIVLNQTQNNIENTFAPHPKGTGIVR